MSTTASTKSPANGVVTVDQWAKRAVHKVTCPSGAVIEMMLPDLSRLLRNNALPDRLRAAALKQAFDDIDYEPASDEAPAADAQEKRDQERYETAKDLIELLDTLLIDAIVSPKLERDDIDKIPGEDRDMLVAIIQRERVTDAQGVRLGVVPLSAFESFREFHGCDKHGDEGCENCKALQQRFSTSDVGGV